MDQQKPRPVGPGVYKEGLTVEQQERVLGMERIREAFMRRSDIVSLSPEEQERRWEQHKLAVLDCIEFLSDKPTYVVCSS